MTCKCDRKTTCRTKNQNTHQNKMLSNITSALTTKDLTVSEKYQLKQPKKN